MAVMVTDRRMDSLIMASQLSSVEKGWRTHIPFTPFRAGDKNSHKCPIGSLNTGGAAWTGPRTLIA
jgi:hypothetical protein